MTRRTKRETEVFIVKSMLSLMKKPTEWVFPGTDPPDVLIRLDNVCVGIEVTDYLPEPATASPHRRKQLACIDELKEWLWMGRCAHPELDRVHAHLFFKTARGGKRVCPEFPGKTQYPEFTRQIFICVSHYTGRLTKTPLVLEDFASGETPLLQEYLRRLRLEKLSCFMSWDISSETTDTQFGPEFAEEELMRLIKRKRQSIARSLDQEDRRWLVTELWLVVVAGDMYAPTYPIDIRKLRSFERLTRMLESLPSGLTRVFLYNYYLSGLLEWRRGAGWTETVEVF